MQRTALILSAFVSVIALGQALVPAQAADNPKIVAADAMSWAPAQGLPPGAQVAVLYGDPSKAGPFAIRFKFPAGYEIATHSHPTDEFLTIISGQGRMTFGPGADATNAQALSQGTFMSLPAEAQQRFFA